MPEVRNNPIADENAFTIVCPYCFNRASGGDGQPIPHTKVEFRSITAFANVHEIELKFGLSELDIELLDDAKERAEKTKKFKMYKKFCMGKDEKYQAFWDNYEGKTTEESGRAGSVQNPWELPIISLGNGVEKLHADVDGFVDEAIDVFGKPTSSRVCPYCHNPFPLGFGKNKVKYISIIGITGSGKTVYISQLLRGLGDYAPKVGLSANFTSTHEPDFIAKNRVKKGMPLPDSTSPRRLSQPMFYDILRNENGVQKRDTIVLYDIAGENCRRAEDMVQFSQFVKHSDGLILLVDPKQLNFISDETDDEVDAPSLALTTLHSVLETRKGEKCDIPVAVCVSKSDQCISGILPSIAQEAVQSTGFDGTGLPLKEFDGKTYNKLTVELTKRFRSSAPTVCQNLNDSYSHYNFFAVSATGCACEATEAGFYAPVSHPDPKRIEEPILWLFKQFGFIKSNEKIVRPFPIEQGKKYVYKKPFFGKPYLEQLPTEYARYEEDPIRRDPLVLKKKEWSRMTQEDKMLPIKQEGDNA